MRYNKYSVLLIVFVLVGVSFWGSVSAAGVGNDTTANVTNSTGLADSDWPSFQNDANKTGLSNYTGPQTNTTKWTFDNITVYGSAVIGKDGKIYIGGVDGKLYVFNPDGILLWTYTTRSSIYGSPSIGSDGVVYISNWMNSTTYALSSDGSLIWKYSTGGYNFGSSPVIGFDGTVYVGVTNDTNGTLYAVDSAGKVKWSYVMGLIYGISPVVGSDGTVYMADYDGVIYAINHDGSLKWSYRLKYYDPNVYVDYFVNMYYNTLSLGSDGTIYIACHNGRFISGPIVNRIKPEYGVLFALTDMGDGAVEKWSYNVGEALFGAPAIGSDGKIYVVGASGLHALDLNGNVLWSYVTGLISETGLTSAAIGKDGTIYFGSGSGLYALKPDGDLKWSYATGSVIGSPAIGSDGTLYIGSINGTFYAFNDIAADFVVESVKKTVLTVQFTGDSTDTPSSWWWDFGDGTTAAVQNPRHTYDNAGNYTVTLAVTLNDDSVVKRIRVVSIEEMDVIAPTVTASLAGGTYSNAQDVVLTGADDRGDVTVYYTVDGSDPRISGSRRIYSGSVVVSDSCTLSFVAVDGSGNWSPVYSELYDILGNVYVYDASYYSSETMGSDIQAVLDDARFGSTVVFLGSFYEDLQLVISKRLNIVSNVGTRIVNDSVGSAVFLIDGISASGTSISGFNIITNSDSGILVNNTFNVVISDVQVSSVKGTAISINKSTNTTIKNSSLTDSSTGIYVHESNNTQLTGNTIIGNGKTGSDSRCGVYIENSDNVKVSNSQITGNYYGIITKNINRISIDHNNISNNDRDGILLNGDIKNTIILSNTIDSNNNGIQINGPDENLTLQSNIITFSKYVDGVDKSYNGDGLVFGPSSIYSKSLIVNHNIILRNDHRDIETRYGGESIADVVGSNWSGCGCGAPSHDQCGPHCQCKNWDPEMKMEIIRTGNGTFTVQFRDGRPNGGLVTDLPPFDVRFIMGPNSRTLRTKDGKVSITYDISQLMGMLTATAYDHTTSISWNSKITGENAPDGNVGEGLKIYSGNGDGNGPDNNNGGSGTDPGSSSGSGNSGSSSNDGASSGHLALGAAAAASAAGSSSNKGGSSRTVQELILDEMNHNTQVWGILGIIILIIIVTGAYYRNDIVTMIKKSRE